MLGVLQVSTGNGPNGLTLQSQFLRVLPQSSPGCVTSASQGKVLPAQGHVPRGLEGALGARAGSDAASPPTPTLCKILPSCLFLTENSQFGGGSPPKTSGLSPKERFWQEANPSLYDFLPRFHLQLPVQVFGAVVLQQQEQPVLAPS